MISNIRISAVILDNVVSHQKNMCHESEELIISLCDPIVIRRFMILQQALIENKVSRRAALINDTLLIMSNSKTISFILILST